MKPKKVGKWVMFFCTVVVECVSVIEMTYITFYGIKSLHKNFERKWFVSLYTIFYRIIAIKVIYLTIIRD